MSKKSLETLVREFVRAYGKVNPASPDEWNALSVKDKNRRIADVSRKITALQNRVKDETCVAVQEA